MQIEQRFHKVILLKEKTKEYKLFGESLLYYSSFTVLNLCVTYYCGCIQKETRIYKGFGPDYSFQYPLEVFEHIPPHMCEDDYDSLCYLCH